VTTRNEDEILEAIWLAGERDEEPTREAILDSAHGETTDEDLDAAIADALVIESSVSLALTDAGETLAREIVRRHRLAERLLTDVLQVREGAVESSACDFEHFLSPEVTDSICTLLGHPTVCPHGCPIPAGPCCSLLPNEIGPLVRRLADIAPGERVKVVFITSDKEKRLERLGSLGVQPGSVVRLTQRRPSFIIEVDQTTLAIEREVAEGIFVKRWTPGNGR